MRIGRSYPKRPSSLSSPSPSASTTTYSNSRLLLLRRRPRQYPCSSQQSSCTATILSTLLLCNDFISTVVAVAGFVWTLVLTDYRQQTMTTTITFSSSTTPSFVPFVTALQLPVVRHQRIPTSPTTTKKTTMTKEGSNSNNNNNNNNRIHPRYTCGGHPQRQQHHHRHHYFSSTVLSLTSSWSMSLSPLSSSSGRTTRIRTRATIRKRSSTTSPSFSSAFQLWAETSNDNDEETETRNSSGDVDGNADYINDDDSNDVDDDNDDDDDSMMTMNMENFDSLFGNIMDELDDIFADLDDEDDIDIDDDVDDDGTKEEEEVKRNIPAAVNVGNINNSDYDDDDDLEDQDVDDELFSLIQEASNGLQLEDDDVIIADIDNGTGNKDGIDDDSLLRRAIGDDEGDLELFEKASLALEKALLGGVVPPNAGVATDALPGDFGFDPLNLAQKDYIHQAQYRLLSLIPGGNPNNDPPPGPRPTALVLRDYREAEIRHGRLACLAVLFWPLQEKLDKLLLDEDQFGPIMYGPTTLPYFPLLMTLIMMLLGYLDIYANSIKEVEQVGEAFLPGDCFWDPLRILQGAPPSMKRNMQEREIFNCRMAMLAFAAFVFEEVTSHRAVIDIPSNALLFEPIYEVSYVQEWLDQQFS